MSSCRSFSLWKSLEYIPQGRVLSFVQKFFDCFTNDQQIFCHFCVLLPENKDRSRGTNGQRSNGARRGSARAMPPSTSAFSSAGTTASVHFLHLHPRFLRKKSHDGRRHGIHCLPRQLHRLSFSFAGQCNCIRSCLVLRHELFQPTHGVSTILRQQPVSLR